MYSTEWDDPRYNNSSVVIRCVNCGLEMTERPNLSGADKKLIDRWNRRV